MMVRMVLVVFFGGHEVLLSVNYDPTFKLNQCISTLNFSVEKRVVDRKRAIGSAHRSSHLRFQSLWIENL